MSQEVREHLQVVAAQAPAQGLDWTAVRSEARRRTRRRRLSVAAPLLALAVAAPMAWSALPAGGDRLVQQPDVAAPVTQQATFGVHGVLDVARLDGSALPAGTVESLAGQGLDGPTPADCAAIQQGQDTVASPSGAGDFVACAVTGTSVEVYLLERAAVTAGDVADATAVNLGGGWAVQLEFTTAGADAFAELTGQAACAPMGSPQRRIAYVVDGVIINGETSVAPDVECQEGITAGASLITSQISDEATATDLAQAIIMARDAAPDPVESTQFRITYADVATYDEHAEAVSACRSRPGVATRYDEEMLPPISHVTVTGSENISAFRGCVSALAGVTLSVEAAATDRPSQEPNSGAMPGARELAAACGSPPNVARTHEATARCFYAAFLDRSRERAAVYASEEAVDAMFMLGGFPTDDQWRFDGCGRPESTSPSSGVSCRYYIPGDVHGVQVEMAMAADGTVERITAIG